MNTKPKLSTPIGATGRIFIKVSDDHYEDRPVRRDEGGISYYVGDTASDRSGWAPLALSLWSKIVWDVRP